MVEYQKMQTALKQEGSSAVIIMDKAIQVFMRGVFQLYWIADNYMILRKILLGITKKAPKTSSTTFWFWGCVLAILIGVI